MIFELRSKRSYKIILGKETAVAKALRQNMHH
jgi:hypothetical protein